METSWYTRTGMTATRACWARAGAQVCRPTRGIRDGGRGLGCVRAGPGAGLRFPHAGAAAGGPARPVLPDGRPGYPAETATRPPWLTSSRLDWLEACTEELGATIQMPKAFIVPGDSLAGAALEVARTVVRRAERLVARLTHDGEVREDVPLRYLNRLSSLLFVLARLEDHAAGVEQFTLASDGRQMTSR